MIDWVKIDRQDIHTLPKAGTEVLLCNMMGGYIPPPRAVTGSLYSVRNAAPDWHIYAKIGLPTHWAKLNLPD